MSRKIYFDLLASESKQNLAFVSFNFYAVIKVNQVFDGSFSNSVSTWIYCFHSVDEIFYWPKIVQENAMYFDKTH